jgi:hypothetical protein
MILQKHKVTGDNIGIAEMYYGVLSVLNRLKLTKLEIGLLAFMAINGPISDVGVQDGFCAVYKTTVSTVNNTVSKLKKMSLIIKEDGKNIINPKIVLDFSKDVVLGITMLHEKA